MKKILWLLAIFFMISSANAEENLTPQKLAEQQAKTIYENCEQKIPLVNENNVIMGNIADVERVRKIKNCIKDNILKQVQDLQDLIFINPYIFVQKIVMSLNVKTNIKMILL